MEHYSSGIVSYNDMYNIMHRAAILKRKTPNYNDFIHLIQDDNALELVSERDRKRKGAEICRRLAYLDNKLIEWLSGDDMVLGRQVNLLTILRCDKLFYDFMKEVYCSNRKAFYDRVTPGDIISFINQKASTSDTVASWTDYVKKRLAREYIRLLVRSGYGQPDGEDLKISLPFILPELLQHLKVRGDIDLAIILCGGDKV